MIVDPLNVSQQHSKVIRRGQKTPEAPLHRRKMPCCLDNSPAPLTGEKNGTGKTHTEKRKSNFLNFVRTVDD